MRPARWPWRARILAGSLVTLLALAVSVADPAAAAAGLVPVPPTPLANAAPGVDVSASQHRGGAPISWPVVSASGYRFAFIKVTEGSYYVNPYFASDFAAAKAAGLPVAAYHFAYPSDSGGAVQADYAIGHGAYQSDGATLPLVLDIEYDPYAAAWCYGLSPAQMVSWVAAFVGEVQRRTGTTPLIYTPAAWWDKCTGSSGAFAAEQLWAPDYTPGARVPQTPAAGWRGWAFWQYTSSGVVPGISVLTDLSQLNPGALLVAAPGDQSYPSGRTVSVAPPAAVVAPGRSLRYAAAGLPPSLAIDPATGIISGKLPARPVSSVATLTVTGSGLPSVSTRFGLYAHGAVSLSAPAVRTDLAGSPVRLRATAADSLPGCTLRFSATGLPPGSSISQCGLITGTLTSPGGYRPAIEVTDSSGAMLASASFDWRVTTPARPGRLARTG